MKDAALLRANALSIPLRDESVDLIVFSPPYFSLRSYRDGGEHYEGQIGSEPTPQAFLEALWTVMAECWRALKPSGSCWVNLGDKRAGSGGHNNAGISRASQFPMPDGKPSTARRRTTYEAERIGDLRRSTRRNAPDRYNQAAFGRPKSKMLLPHRFAIGCEDGLADPEGKGWVVRQDHCWSKPNGLPESVTDRCRDSHEYVFMLTKAERYFAAVDEVREGYAPATAGRYELGFTAGYANGSGTANGPLRADGGGPSSTNPLGKLPGSVWTIPSEPLIVPEAVKARYDLPDHFAAFPTELVRRIILGWSPLGVCTACGEGRRPSVDKTLITEDRGAIGSRGERRFSDGLEAGIRTRPVAAYGSTLVTITGYACACPEPTAPTRPSVVFDPFGGTGTTAMVARALGRFGISLDLSMDYCRLAKWRIWQSGHGGKAIRRTNEENQGDLFTGILADPAEEWVRPTVDVETGGWV